MKRIITRIIAAAAAIATVAPAVQAAPWQSINQRQYRLTQRINQGVRNHALTRREANSLRSRYWTLARRESRYRRSGHGLSSWERRDLDRRFDALSRSIRVQRHDWQRRRR
jgi:hypothetical protein